MSGQGVNIRIERVRQVVWNGNRRTFFDVYRQQADGAFVFNGTHSAAPNASDRAMRDSYKRAQW